VEIGITKRQSFSNLIIGENQCCSSRLIFAMHQFSNCLHSLSKDGNIKYRQDISRKFPRIQSPIFGASISEPSKKLDELSSHTPQIDGGASETGSSDDRVRGLIREYMMNLPFSVVI
jgi:hypothetical protein